MQKEAAGCKPGRESQVSEQQTMLKIALDRAEAVQTELRDRLDSVLIRQPQPGDGAEVAKDENGLVHLASLLRNAVDRINSMSDEYDAIMGRIEL